MFHVTYLGHSGVFVELDHTQLLFDCIAERREASREEAAKETESDANVHHIHKNSKGTEYDTGTFPKIDPQKKLYVFVSHFHGDHYSKDIWNLRNSHPDVYFLISKDVPFSEKRRNELGLTDADLARVLRVHHSRSYEEFGIHVDTLRSTDMGVAYFVEVDGKTIFHAGDLHLWKWEEEGEAYCADMTRRFELALSRLEGKEADLACLLLDPRLEKTAFEGINRYLNILKVKYILPIHLWKTYSFTRTYLDTEEGSRYAMNMLQPAHEDHFFELEV